MPHVIRHIEVRRDHQLVLTYAHGINTIANIAPLVARGDAGEQSDVDVLVDFEESSTFDGYFGLKFYLEDLLGREVDLVTETGLRPVFRPYVEAEAIEILNLTGNQPFALTKERF